jgi:hypothetical protein
MLFDLVSYSGWLIVALGIGLVVGWRTYLNAPRRDWGDEWIILGALAFVVGIIVAALKLLPGRYGLWLEIALLMIAVYIVGCFLGGGLKRLLGAHESGSVGEIPAAADSRDDGKLEAEGQASAKAAADRLAVEVAARAEAERGRAEIERRAAAAAKAEAERLAAATLAKAEAERLTAAAVAKALADRRALVVNGAAPAGETNGGSARAEPASPARKLTRRHTPSERRPPPATCRRIILWRKPPQRPRLNEKQIRPPKPRRVVWLQRVSQRSRLGEASRPTRPIGTRPMRRRTLWLRRLPRPRPIGTLHYLRRRTEQT